MKIGILAVQGAFIEHKKILNALGCKCIEVRKKPDLDAIDGLVLPGGESTVQGKLLYELDLLDSQKHKIVEGLPVLATCAGLILLAKQISNDPNTYLGTLPVTVKRNAYGRQLGSFTKTANFHNLGSFDMTFIRAPYIEKIDKGVSILARVDHKIVAAQYGNQIGLAFHPELGNDTRIHQYFLDIITKRMAISV